MLCIWWAPKTTRNYCCEPLSNTANASEFCVKKSQNLPKGMTNRFCNITSTPHSCKGKKLSRNSEITDLHHPSYSPDLRVFRRNRKIVQWLNRRQRVLIFIDGIRQQFIGKSNPILLKIFFSNKNTFSNRNICGK